MEMAYEELLGSIVIPFVEEKGVVSMGTCHKGPRGNL